jgi:ubiquitin-protein ligase E3 C
VADNFRKPCLLPRRPIWPTSVPAPTERAIESSQTTMFHSFTGNSRRPRNVNLSGQKTNNPWAAGGFYAPSQGAAQTVAQATADREKRKRERDELFAAKRIQRVWRGHQGRQESRRRLREEWDTLYSSGGSPASERVAKALPLLQALFDASNAGDQARLDSFVREVSSLSLGDLGTISLEPRWDRLSPLLVAALER